MTMSCPRKLRLLSLVLAAAAGAAPRAGASPIAYSTAGAVDAPAAGPAGLVYYNGLSNAAVAPPHGIDLGQFVVSSLAKTADATFKNTPFHVVAYSGSDAGDQINGVLNGMVGPAAGSPSLTATVTSVKAFGGKPLPFGLNIPLNVPTRLTLSDGHAPATTDLTGSASPVPEPSSVAVFSAILGGLCLWGRRHAGR